MSNIPRSAAADVQAAFRDLWAAMPLRRGTDTIDAQSLRLINLTDGRDDQDAVTMAQLNLLRDQVGVGDTVERDPGKLAGTGTGKVRVGAFSTRGAAAAHQGEWFLASDRNYVAWLSLNGTWQYVFGIHQDTIANKPTLATGDAGYRFTATDFARLYRWSGSAWADAPGQPDRGQVAYFTDGLLPGTGWALCDGSSVTRSTPTAGTTSITVPNLTGSNRFIRSVSGTTGGTGGSATTHTHPIDPPATNGTATTGSNSASREVQSGTGSTVADNPHSHQVTVTIDVASFTSGTPSGTSGDDALPPYLNLRPYMRL